MFHLALIAVRLFALLARALAQQVSRPLHTQYLRTRLSTTTTTTTTANASTVTCTDAHCRPAFCIAVVGRWRLVDWIMSAQRAYGLVTGDSTARQACTVPGRSKNKAPTRAPRVTLPTVRSTYRHQLKHPLHAPHGPWARSRSRCFPLSPSFAVTQRTTREPRTCVPFLHIHTSLLVHHLISFLTPAFHQQTVAHFFPWVPAARQHNTCTIPSRRIPLLVPSITWWSYFTTYFLRLSLNPT